MKREHKEWLDNNQVYLGNVTLNRVVIDMLFEIYNDLTGENKRPTGCGRCVANIKKRIQFEYEKENNRN